MNELFKILNLPYYLGLGNHDIENNLNNTFENIAIFVSIYNLSENIKKRTFENNGIPNRVDYATKSTLVGVNSEENSSNADNDDNKEDKFITYNIESSFDYSFNRE